MNNYVINVMNKYGYFGILFLITIENIFPPIPSEVILTLGGFMTKQDGVSLNIVCVIIFSTLGSIIGAVILYFVGFIFNKDRLRKIINSKLGKVLHLSIDNVEKSNNTFNKNGNLTVLYSRFIPIIRSLISIPAGMNKMNFILFLIYTTIGSIIWNTVLVTLGALVGENYMLVAGIFSKYSKAILFGLIILVIYKIIMLFKKRI